MLSQSALLLYVALVRGFRWVGGPATPASYSHFGVLGLKMSYQTTVDQYGNTLYCFVTADGAESPTLHVNPEID